MAIVTLELIFTQKTKKKFLKVLAIAEGLSIF